MKRGSLLTEDADFGKLLPLRATSAPSVVLMRHRPDKTGAALSKILLANSGAVAEDLVAGSLVVTDSDWMRVRRLPLHRAG